MRGSGGRREKRPRRLNHDAEQAHRHPFPRHSRARVRPGGRTLLSAAAVPLYGMQSRTDTLRPASVPMPGDRRYSGAAGGGSTRQGDQQQWVRRSHHGTHAPRERVPAGRVRGGAGADLGGSHHAPIPTMLRSAADAHRSVSSVQSSRVRGADGATLPTYGNWVRSHMLSAGHAARATQVGEQAVGLNLRESETLQSFVVHALGAACHSGRSCFIVQNTVRDEQTGEVCARRVMLDCGIDPLPKTEADAMPDMAAIARLRPDVIVLTHNHADHSGALPHLVTEMGMTDIPILATPPTVDSVRVVASLAPSSSGPMDPDELPPHMKALGAQTWFAIMCMENNVALEPLRASVTLGEALDAEIGARLRSLVDDGLLLASHDADASRPVAGAATAAAGAAVACETRVLEREARALFVNAQRLPPEARELTVGEALMGLRILRRLGFAGAFQKKREECTDRNKASLKSKASLAPASGTAFDARTLPSYMRVFQGYAAADLVEDWDRHLLKDEQCGCGATDAHRHDASLVRQLGVYSRAIPPAFGGDAKHDTCSSRSAELARPGRIRLSRGGSMALVARQADGEDGDDESDETQAEVMYGPDAAGAEVTQPSRSRADGSQHTQRKARAPAFSREAWARVAAQMHPLNYRQVWRSKGISVTLLPAGHMLGAAMVLVEIGSARLLYTGDFLLRGMTHLAPVVPRSLGAVDVLMTESTCGTMMRRDDARISRSAVDTAVRRALSDPRAVVVIPARPFSIIDIAIVMEILWRRLPVDFAASCPVYVAGERAKMYLRVLEAYADLWASDVVRSLLVPADETEQAPHPQPRGRPETEAGGRQTESVAGRWRPGARMRIGWRHVRFVSEEAAIKMTDARVLLCDHLCASRAVRRWSNPPRSCQPHVLITGAAPPPRTFLGVIATNDVRSIEALGFPDPVTRPVALHVNLWEHASFKQVQELVRAVRPRVLVLIHGVRRCMEDMKRAMERDGTFVGPVLVPRTGEQMTPWTQPLRRNPVIDKRPAGIPLAEWERQKAAEAERRARMELPTALLGDVVGDRFESFGGPSHAHWRSLPPRSSVEVDAAAV